MKSNLIKKVVFFSLPIFLLFFYNVYPNTTKEDEKYLLKFLGDWRFTQSAEAVHKNFESEINCIKLIQDSVIAQIKHQEVAHQNFGSLKFYYENKKGFCYDRAVVLEKIFYHLGFQFRHVFVYYNNNGKTGVSDFFKKGTGSHALLEVKTCKGWLAVGSNENWIGLINGEPITVKKLQEIIRSGKDSELAYQSSTVFYKEHPDFHYVYGLYSRHGDFFSSKNVDNTFSLSPKFNILPDYNIRMLLFNF